MQRSPITSLKIKSFHTYDFYLVVYDEGIARNTEMYGRSIFHILNKVCLSLPRSATKHICIVKPQIPNYLSFSTFSTIPLALICKTIESIRFQSLVFYSNNRNYCRYDHFGLS